jgi:hypothetical protein
LGLAKFRIFDIFQTEVNTTAHVTGEITKALFGRSVLGAWHPMSSPRVFPRNSLGQLDMLSNVGPLLFHFRIGSVLDSLDSSRDALGISISFIFFGRLKGTNPISETPRTKIPSIASTVSSPICQIWVEIEMR